MHTIRIEHLTADYDAWKAAFDSDPVGRERGGVRAYRVGRAADNPAYVVIDLDFDDEGRALAFRGALEAMWQMPLARSVLGGAPQARLVEQVEAHAY